MKKILEQYCVQLEETHIDYPGYCNEAFSFLIFTPNENYTEVKVDQWSYNSEGGIIINSSERLEQLFKLLLPYEEKTMDEVLDEYCILMEIDNEGKEWESRTYELKGNTVFNIYRDKSTPNLIYIATCGGDVGIHEYNSPEKLEMFFKSVK